MIAAIAFLALQQGAIGIDSASSSSQIFPLRPPIRHASVLIFVLDQCPIAREYSPEIHRLSEKYRPKGVQFTLVHVDRELTAVAALKHQKEFDITFPVGIDRKHALVQLAGITKVPCAAVYDSSGKLRYCGRIDDRYATFGTLRPRIKSHDLRDALDAVLTGKPVKRARTEAIGCYVPD